MKSLGTEKFWRAYRALPPGIKDAARAAHQKFLESPAHPALQLERLRSDPRFWSVRVTRDYRAIAIGSLSGSVAVPNNVIVSPV